MGRADNRGPVRLLATAFGPFPGAPVNPTPGIIRALSKARIGGVRLATHVFETRYDAVDRDLPALIAAHQPDVLLLFGLAARTPHLRLETRAVNRTARLKPDAGGRRVTTRAVTPGGPAHRRTSVAAGRLAAHLRACGLAARPSRSAGDYLCNYAYFRALEAVAAGQTGVALFVHVPLPRAPYRPKGPNRRRRMVAADLARAAGLIARRITRS